MPRGAERIARNCSLTSNGLLRYLIDRRRLPPGCLGSVLDALCLAWISDLNELGLDCVSGGPPALNLDIGVQALDVQLSCSCLAVISSEDQLVCTHVGGN